MEGVLLGGSLGAAMTFLFGTSDGKRLQKKLLHKYKAFEQEAQKYRKTIKAVTDPVAKKLKRLAKAKKSAPTRRRKTRSKTRRKTRSR